MSLSDALRRTPGQLSACVARENTGSSCLMRSVIMATFWTSLQLDSPAEDVAIVAPNNLDHTEGNSGSDFPFGNSGPIRFQQVFDASQFTPISNGGGWINLIFFRTDSGAGLGSAAVVTNLQ